MTTATPPVLIAGFHRSGTSAVALALRNAGLDLGTNLLGAEPSNPYGHFEDIDVIAAHDRALKSCGLTWKSPSSPARPLPALEADIVAYIAARSEQVPPGTSWGVKDPRICLFLREWLTVLPSAVVVVVFRSPGDAIASLHRRHARRYVDSRQIDPSDLAFWQSPDLGLQLWIHYYEELLTSLPPNANVHAIDFADRQSILTSPNTLRDSWRVGLDSEEPTVLDASLGMPGADAVEVRDISLIEKAEQVWGRLKDLSANNPTSH